MSVQRHTQSSARDRDDAAQSSPAGSRGRVSNSDQALLAEGQYPREVTIRGELVHAASREEHNEALALIDRIEVQLGADLDGAGGMRALEQFYKRRSVREELGLDRPPSADTRHVSAWALVDLRAIAKVLPLVAPYLKAKPREGLHMTKVDDEVMRGSAEARYLGDDGKAATDFIVFSPEWSKQEGDNYKDAPPDNRELTVAHEIAHDLFKHKEKDWERRIRWWRNEPNAEPPASAWQRPAEDIAHSVALYLLGRLGSFPERTKVVEEYLAEMGLLEHIKAQQAQAR